MLVYRGPQPYTELDEKRFFGRDREIGELISLIERNRLAVVTAPSGVGKTSVILAGVVPRMRRRHEEEFPLAVSPDPEEREQQEALRKQDVVIGPVIVCRGWSGSMKRSPDRILMDAVAEGVLELSDPKKSIFLAPSPEAPSADLLEHLKKEANDLKRILSNEAPDVDWVDAMTSCADAVGRLILIFDQFEDALRLPGAKGRKVLQTISSLFNQEPRIRVVLSFRQEFIMNLHDLELSIGGLAKRTYYLQAIKRSEVRDIVVKPATDIITVTERAVEKIKAWLKASEATEEGRPSSAEAADDTSEDEAAEIPLLALQALLVDVHEFLTSRANAEGRIIVDDLGLDEYKKIRGVPEKDLAARALEKHIDNVLSRRSEDPEVANLFDTVARGTTTMEKDRLIRRLFARMPSHLTSGSIPGSPGYKNQVRLGKMLKDVLREEFELLGLDFAAMEFEDLIAYVKDPARKTVDMKFDRDADISNRSGMARRGDWKTERTGAVLVVALAELLRRLVGGNILKPLGSGVELAYELVHDGLGPAVQTWADRFQDTVDDALGSLTRLSGIRFRWAQKNALAGMTIDNASWSGCVISGQDLSSVRFQSCDLRGTMFVGCSFAGGQFQDCNLNGAMFINSKFLADPKNPSNPHMFCGGTMTSALFQKCDFWSAALSDLMLDGTVFLDNDVLGKLHIERSSVKVVVFLDCTHEADGQSGNADCGIFIKNCDFVFSRIIAGRRGQQTAIFMDGPPTNFIFPEDQKLLITNPRPVHWKPPEY